jgi:hypothetical protein
VSSIALPTNGSQIEQNATSNEEQQEPSFSLREGVLFFQGNIRERTVLNNGDKIQLWVNDRRRTGENPTTGKPYQDPELYVKVLSKEQQEKGSFMSRVISGLWSRVKRQN